MHKALLASARSVTSASSRRPRHRGVAAVLVAALGAAALVATPGDAQAADTGSFTFIGHGYGHGRGMGQYGAYGYAVDHGWSYAQILAHYYGGTTLAGDAGNPTLGVELTKLTGVDTAVAGTSLTVDGVWYGAGAVKLTRVGPGQFQLYTSSGCDAGWTVSGGVRGGSVTIGSNADPADATTLLRVCGSTKIAYRGSLRVLESQGRQTVINDVLVEDYLRGVVPRESPASWGSAGGGRGMQALQAQTVAARSYALASAPRPSGARTCDTTACQVYGGAYSQVGAGALTALENPLTDSAVRATAGQVMRSSGGGIARTEFSSSTGGWTAGGAFPAVEDLGDATASNPNHTWTVTLTQASVAAALGVGPLASMSVTGRNGLGADGGRVTQVTVRTTTGEARVFSGSDVRLALGLRSDWFSISGMTSDQATKLVRALYLDILGREPDAEGLAGWSTAVMATGDTAPVAGGIVMSTERLYTFVRRQYLEALKREPDPTGTLGWVAALQQGMTVPELQVQVYASEEGYWVVGHNDPHEWVSGVYQGILGRPAAPAEQAAWAAAVATSGRQAVVRSIVLSDEAALRRLTEYYQLMLGRAPDAAGIASFKPMMAGNGDFVLPIEIGRSQEYFIRSQSR